MEMGVLTNYVVANSPISIRVDIIWCTLIGLRCANAFSVSIFVSLIILIMASACSSHVAWSGDAAVRGCRGRRYWRV